jgi:hypothetical protein
VFGSNSNGDWGKVYRKSASLKPLNPETLFMLCKHEAASRHQTLNALIVVFSLTLCASSNQIKSNQKLYIKNYNCIFTGLYIT